MCKIISFLLLIILILITIIGCAKENENKSNETLSNQNEETIEDLSNKIPDPILKPYNLNGRDYHLLVPASVGWVNSRDFEYFPELAGEPVNDAVQGRIIAVEELYNCVIKATKSGAMVSDARREILANGTTFDVIMPALTEVSQIAGEGLLLDLYKIDTLYFEMPWWSTKSCEYLSILNKLYYTIGDISIIDNDGIGAMIFNKALIISNSLEMPYQFVYEGIWTFDKLYSICKGISRDLNGDGIMDKDDQYGFITDNGNILGMLYAGGNRLVTKDKDDIPSPSIDNDRTMKIIDKVIEIFNDKTTFAQTMLFGDAVACNNAFMNNQILIRYSAMFRFTQIREMENDFGFLPLPKFDEVQESHHHSYSYASPGVGIPITVKDPEENGAVLEALAYYGRTVLLPAYYEINLQTKITRDEDSPKMLDIIFDTGIVDLGYIYNFGGMREMFAQFVNNNANTFPSAYASLEVKIQTEIDKLVDTFREVS